MNLQDEFVQIIRQSVNLLSPEDYKILTEHPELVSVETQKRVVDQGRKILEFKKETDERTTQIKKNTDEFKEMAFQMNQEINTLKNQKNQAEEAEEKNLSLQQTDELLKNL